MTKQEEIRVGLGKLRMSARPDSQGINRPSFLSPDDVEVIRHYLNEKGVVIAVDNPGWLLANTSVEPLIGE